MKFWYWRTFILIFLFFTVIKQCGLSLLDIFVWVYWNDITVPLWIHSIDVWNCFLASDNLEKIKNCLLYESSLRKYVRISILLSLNTCQQLLVLIEHTVYNSLQFTFTILNNVFLKLLEFYGNVTNKVMQIFIIKFLSISHSPVQ